MLLRRASLRIKEAAVYTNGVEHVIFTCQLPGCVWCHGLSACEYRCPRLGWNAVSRSLHTIQEASAVSGMGAEARVCAV